MMKRISLFILIITILAVVLTCTSCSAEGEGGSFVSSLLDFFPEDGGAITDTAHNVGAFIEDAFNNFLSFDWAKQAWSWLDASFGISEKAASTQEAFGLITSGNLGNLIKGFGMLISSGVILVIIAVIVIVVIILTIIFELIMELITIVLAILGIAVLLGLVILAFVKVVLPFI